VKHGMSRRAVLLTATGLLVGVAPFGCGKPQAALPAKVGGQVTVQGRPLAGGLIVFVPDPDRCVSGTMLSAALGGDGSFTLADGGATVAPGWYRVAIAEPAGYYDSGFPPQLRRPDRSGIEREVKPGHEHHFEFQIEMTR
jgi:hypothetical protein